MGKIIDIVQIVISALLITSILLQQKGEGLSGAFGGQGGGGGVYFKKRGMEKILFVASIVLAGLFILSAIVRMVIS
jgi:protein translocase SecG subunit